jgi:hypothetical protein
VEKEISWCHAYAAPSFFIAGGETSARNIARRFFLMQVFFLHGLLEMLLGDGTFLLFLWKILRQGIFFAECHLQNPSLTL